jgi:hypothetical protein
MSRESSCQYNNQRFPCGPTSPGSQGEEEGAESSRVRRGGPTAIRRHPLHENYSFESRSQAGDDGARHSLRGDRARRDDTISRQYRGWRENVSVQQEERARRENVSVQQEYRARSENANVQEDRGRRREEPLASGEAQIASRIVEALESMASEMKRLNENLDRMIDSKK